MWTTEAYKRWWHRMGQIFGRPWYDQHGPEANETWCMSLSELSFERAAAVLEHYRTADETYPPNCSQVMALARQIRLSAPAKALPPPSQSEKTPEIVQAAISQIRNPYIEKNRNVFRKGESLRDYLDARTKSGKTNAQFDAERLHANGWSAHNEVAYQNHGHMCPNSPIVDGNELVCALAAIEQSQKPEAA